MQRKTYLGLEFRDQRTSTVKHGYKDYPLDLKIAAVVENLETGRQNGGMVVVVSKWLLFQNGRQLMFYCTCVHS